MAAGLLALSPSVSGQTFDLASTDTGSKVAAGNFFKVNADGFVSTFASPEFSDPISESSDSLYTIEGVGHSATNVGTESGSVPSGFSLDQNFPNPFNPSTTIRFSISTPARISLVLYDLTGRAVRTLVNNDAGAGTHTVQWDGRSENGATVSSGVYVYRLLAAGRDGKVHSDSKKMILMK